MKMAHLSSGGKVPPRFFHNPKRLMSIFLEKEVSDVTERFPYAKI